jgi:hypothetical protein
MPSAVSPGGATDTGFSLDGMPALILFAVVIAYFVIGHKYAGGTIWAADPRSPLSPFSQKKNARRGGRSAGVSQVERGVSGRMISASVSTGAREERSERI